MRRAAVILMAATLLAPAPALACKKNKFKKEKPKISQIDKAKPEKLKLDEKILMDKWNDYQCMILDGKIRIYHEDSGLLKDYDVHEINLVNAVGISCNDETIVTVTKKEISMFYGIKKLTDTKELDRKELWRKCHINIDGLDAFATATTEDMLAVIGRKGVLFVGRKDTGKSLSETSIPSKCEDIPKKKFSLLFPKDLKAEDIAMGTFKNYILLAYKGSGAVYKFKLSDDKKEIEYGKPVKCLDKFKKVPKMEEKEDIVIVTDGGMNCHVSLE